MYFFSIKFRGGEERRNVAMCSIVCYYKLNRFLTINFQTTVINQVSTNIVLMLKVPHEQELLAVEKALLSKEIKFKKWIEQPENYPTCIALKPYVKTDVQKLLRKYKMLK